MTRISTFACRVIEVTNLGDDRSRVGLAGIIQKQYNTHKCHMPETLSPGIYFEELSSLPHPIDYSSGGLSGWSSGRSSPGSGTGQLHFFPAQGNVLWGSRTSSQDTQWQYINVRRFVLFIEQSLQQQLQWVVFENNGPALWQRVSQLIDGFLNSQWQSGKLHGKKQQEAYFVQCNNTTTTQTDIANGRLVIIVGFAPVYPAEFIVIQITGQTNQSQTNQKKK